MRTKSRSLSKLGIFLIFAAVFSFIIFYLTVMLSNQGYSFVDVETMELVQTQEIAEDAPVAVIQTTAGEIRAVLYPELAPQTVAQFIELAEAGFYDDTSVFEVEPDVYFAAGGTENGGMKDAVAEEQEHVPRELHQNLWPFKGALCAMNTAVEGGVFDRFFKNQSYFTGSRFMVLGSVDFSDPVFQEEFREASGSEILADAFIERGGVPNFSQQMTIFGQTYEGFDVIDAICSMETEEETNLLGYKSPKEDIRIISVTIETYAAAGNAR